MSFWDKYRVNWYRCLGLYVILYVFYSEIVNFENIVSIELTTVESMIAQIHYELPSSYLHSPLYWLMLLIIFWGCILLSLEKKE